MDKHDFEMFVHCGEVLDRLAKLSGEIEDIRRDLVYFRDSLPDTGQFYDVLYLALDNMVVEIMQERDKTVKEYCAVIDARNERYKEICNKKTCEKQT